VLGLVQVRPLWERVLERAQVLAPVRVLEQALLL
jgi:hypothetical protein